MKENLFAHCSDNPTNYLEQCRDVSGIGQGEKSLIFTFVWCLISIAGGETGCWAVSAPKFKIFITFTNC